MEGFEGLVNLKRLYLEKNCIVRLEGLQNCRKLEELYLSKQTLPNDVEFTFDDYTLAAISMSLRVLDVQQCNVIQADPIYYLESLVQLNMRDNYIGEIEGVIQFLRTLNNLRELDLRGNPVQKQKEIKAEKQNQAIIRRQNSTSRLVGQNQPQMSDFQSHSTTAPNFGSKRQGSQVKPGNLSQQNQNPFGVTNRGYKGHLVKGMGKPPLSNMNNNGQPNKVMQQAGLSILGNQMTLGGTMYEGNQNYNDSNVDSMGQDGQYSAKNAAPKRYSANLVSNTDFSMGTQHMNTKMMPRRL
ncbi:leucine-rich repeat protein [Stylonychia lemnae]|uniref:Leucine-rich repeat protein n=1 Tax=Stylonychia lemnae TaxID=5949 RepID=A0A078B504_STYLE|nr:leucine-rich repeat protein [Stylonychia lemnae]|eukprot:CDW88312.1 leucine-rich repeat protein [Stylonychia lemnae]